MKKITYTYLAIALFVMIGLFVVIDTGYTARKAKTGFEDLTGAVVTRDEDAGLMYCNNYDINNLADVTVDSLSGVKKDVKGCLAYADIFSTYINQNGLEGIDPLLLMSIASQESNCNPNANARGIMAVDDPCGKSPTACPTVEKQIDEGTKNFISNYNALKNKGISQKDAFILTLFGYNRGVGTATKAAEKVAGGMDVNSAMLDSCSVNFRDTPDVCQGDYSLCRFDSKGNDKCTDPGYGAKYPELILDLYRKYCEAAKGEIKNGIYISTALGSGTYQVSPHFTTRMQYDLSDYDIIKTFSEDVKAACVDSVETCFQEQVQKFNAQNQTSRLNTDCESGSVKVFYDFMERLQECSEQNLTACGCSLMMYYDQQTITDKHLAGHYEIDFEQADGIVMARMVSPRQTFYSFRTRVNYSMPKRYTFSYTDTGEYAGSLFYEGQATNYDGQKLYLYMYGNATANMSFRYDNGDYVFADATRIDGDDPSAICSYQKKKFRLCLESSQTIDHLDEHQNLVHENVLIKFAVGLYDVTAPAAVSGLTMTNVSDYAYLIEWENPDEKILGYTVYISDTAFIGSDPSAFIAMGGQRSEFKDFLTMQDVEYGQRDPSCDATGCYLDAGKPFNKIYQPGKIYTDSAAKKKLLFMMLPVTHKFFGLAAIDESGNVLDTDELTRGKNYLEFTQP
jgi:hypothetical protein